MCAAETDSRPRELLVILAPSDSREKGEIPRSLDDSAADSVPRVSRPFDPVAGSFAFLADQRLPIVLAEILPLSSLSLSLPPFRARWKPVGRIY